MSGRMHTDEVATDEHLVRRLVARQFPRWAGLRVKALAASGTVNALFHVGDQMVARLPRRVAGDVDREHSTLYRLAPQLPVEIPQPIAKGSPHDGYPFEWCIDRWIPGDTAPVDGSVDQAVIAGEMAAFLQALQGIDTTDAPPAGRGTSLERWDPPVRETLPQIASEFDTASLLAIWDRILALAEWSHRTVWIHGDLIPGNILLEDGHVRGILDWGGSGLGDPATDLMFAWNVLNVEGRARLRSLLDVDDATWARGRGWALWTGVMARPYYRTTNPYMAENARYRLEQVLADGET